MNESVSPHEWRDELRKCAWELITFLFYDMKLLLATCSLQIHSFIQQIVAEYLSHAKRREARGGAAVNKMMPVFVALTIW